MTESNRIPSVAPDMYMSLVIACQAVLIMSQYQVNTMLRVKSLVRHSILTLIFYGKVCIEFEYFKKNSIE